MSARRLRLGLAVAVALCAQAAQAIEYRSVAEPAILYDTPSERGNKLHILRPGTPVEVVVSLDKWIKVRDAGGGLLWIERKALSDKRTVIVTAARAQVRQQASATAAVAFEAARDLVLEVQGAAADGWLRVRHADGSAGYIRVTEVWGI